MSAQVNYAVCETDGLDKLFLQIKFIVVCERRQFLRFSYAKNYNNSRSQNKVMETKLTRVARLFDEVLEYLTKIFLACETCYIVDAFER